MNNDPIEDPLAPKPPFSGPYEQYGSQPQAPIYYQVPPPTGQYVPPGGPGIPSAPPPGWAPPTIPTPIPPAPIPGPNYYGPPYGQPASVPPAQKQTTRNIVLIVIVLCIIIGGTISFLALQKPHGSSTTQQNTQQSNTNATATAPVVSTYPSYLPSTGTLVIDDPLQHADNWSDSTTGHCLFTNNTYHVRTLTNNVLYSCYAQPDNTALENVTNSAFEVQMTIVQGDCGGLAFRASLSNFPQHYKFYVVSICQDGKFALFKYNVARQGYDTIRTYTYSAAFNAGINQENMIDVVAMGSTLSIFLNKQQVAKVQDTSLTQGNFGLIANAANDNITEVVYRAAKIWTLP